MDVDPDRFDSRRSTVYANRGVVSTSQPLAAQAGVRTLREGGNAFDAAVATAAALNVVEPMSTGIGGDAFALYRTADGEVGALRSCGGAPQRATREAVRDRVGDGDDAEMPDFGPLAITVPGAARGWEHTVETHGRLSFDEVLQPAIEYATEGYPVSEIIADAWAVCAERFVNEAGREAYLPGGEAPDVGQTVTLPDLGETFETVAREGTEAFYEGAIAEQIGDAVQAEGGLLAAEDLDGFTPDVVDPVSTNYRGATVYELPPNNQGLIALEALNVAEEIGAGDHDYDSPERVHAFAESMKRAFHDGHHYITDPDFESVPDLHAESYAAERAASIDDTAGEVSVGGPGLPDEDSDTVLLTVADEAGNVVSFINSLYNGFGSGVVVPDTGIVLQNRGASFSLDPDHPNTVEPGKKPFHTLIPGLVELDDEDWAAFGVMGGYMQPQGHVQVLSNVLDYDMPLQRAFDAPRWRYLEDGRLALEERLAGEVGAALSRKEHDVAVLPARQFGGGQITRREPDGTLSGATEPRKDGSSVGF